MTTISAKIIKSSIGVTKGGPTSPLHTLFTRYPRWIHAEARTHRQISWGEEFVEIPTPSLMEEKAFSRNASSSRAIPVNKMIEDVINDPAVPLFWYKNTKGMQGKELFPPDKCEELKAQWLKDRDIAVERALFYAKFDGDGCHKQIVNRILEPYSHINVLVTATEWSNYFALRDHADAEPHIMLLAQAMKKAIEESTPQFLDEGQWHLPYYDDPVDYSKKDNVEYALRISLARSASLSYKTVDGLPMDADRALQLAQKLIISEPLHASPAEHQAMVSPVTFVSEFFFHQIDDLRHGNLAKGWVQYRKTLPNECL